MKRKRIFTITSLIIMAVVLIAPVYAKAGRIKVDIDTSIEQDRNAGTDLYDTKCYYKNVLPLDITVSNGSDASKLHDERYSTSLSLPEGTEITVTSESVMHGIYVIWDSLVNEWTLKIGDNSYTYGKNGYLHEYLELPEETTSFTIVIPNGYNEVERNIQNMRISDIMAFDSAELPAFVQTWEPVCDEADILVFSTHADDEQIFFGGILPIYQVQNDYRVQYAFFTQYWNNPDQHIREHEKLNGLWLTGCKYYPIMGPFDDAYSTTYEGASETINEEDARLYLTKCIRTTHPQVAVTQDINGEYGHGQHIFMTGNVIEAITLANDSSYDTGSVDMYGLWDTPKFYIHLYENDQILMDMRSELDKFGGKRAIDIARQGYLCHQSQQWCDFSVNDYGPYNAALYGLYKTNVGADVAKNDFMENLKSYDVMAEEKRLEEERIALEEKEKRKAEEAALEAAKQAEEEAVGEEKEESKESKLNTEEKILLGAFGVITVIVIGFVSYIFIDKNMRNKKKRRKR